MKNKGEHLKEKKQVMLHWKKAYLEALIDELHPHGDVLEVGFGLGYAAERIQSFKPKTHTIIEQNHELANAARSWAKKYPHVSIFEDSWESKLPHLGIFDTLFFNDYPIDSEAGMLKRINPEEIKMTSIQAKELLDKLEGQISQIEMHYTDQEIEEFYQTKGQFNLSELPHFFKKLKEYGYITEKQYREVLKKYHLDKAESQGKAMTKEEDRAFAFLEDCLKNHMRKGSRFSCFSNEITSKYEDAQFFENVITNPYIDYHEKVVSIKVPQFFEHYKFDEGLILIVEKFS